jgi:hypothetical protein
LIKRKRMESNQNLIVDIPVGRLTVPVFWNSAYWVVYWDEQDCYYSRNKKLVANQWMVEPVTILAWEIQRAGSTEWRDRRGFL